MSKANSSVSLKHNGFNTKALSVNLIALSLVALSVIILSAIELGLF